MLSDGVADVGMRGCIYACVCMVDIGVIVRVGGVISKVTSVASMLLLLLLLLVVNVVWLFCTVIDAFVVGVAVYIFADDVECCGSVSVGMRVVVNVVVDSRSVAVHVCVSFPVAFLLMYDMCACVYMIHTMLIVVLLYATVCMLVVLSVCAC